MEGKKESKVSAWHIIVTVLVALIAFGKMGSRLYQEQVVEPRQQEESKNSLMVQVLKMAQARYDHMDMILKDLNKEISGVDKAEDGNYIESIVRVEDDIVLTTVMTKPLEPKDLKEISEAPDKVKRETLAETLPSVCEKGFFRNIIDDDFNVKLVHKDINKKEYISYVITKSDCENFESKNSAVPKKR
ncbi:hypothetical protein EDF88_0008 [Buttiauxella sp. BIGb0552]|uniref:hypothetical protein n=1 Tax=Buttiauxella sp. BIGb0552 TaxID=2485120 RepID=UPI001064FA6B|nr:hypothetical protein [Buttiauxella sp. BIGb0552]TDX19827.1 hypothetical protein EDF88_0008 [Buttiauxella sp. BIGb0552]